MIEQMDNGVSRVAFATENLLLIEILIFIDNVVGQTAKYFQNCHVFLT